MPPTADKPTGDRASGYLPFEFAVDFLEFLRAHDDRIHVLTYDNLPWGHDFNYRGGYPGEYKRWKKRLKRGRLDPAKVYVLLQHDVDSAPRRTMNLLREESRLGLPSNVMIFRRRVDRRRLRATGELHYTDYPLDLDLLERLQDEQGFVVGYHSNVYEQALFDERAAMRVFERDVAELRRRFPVRYFSPHGGARGPEGRSNRDLPVPKSLRRSVRWVANRFGVRFDATYSDGGINNPRSTPEDRDLRDFVRTWKPGKRYRVLLHPQYYHTPCKVSPRLEGTVWYDELLAFYKEANRGSGWADVPPPGG